MYAIVYMFLHQFQVPIFITDYLSVLVPYIFTSFSNCNCNHIRMAIVLVPYIFTSFSNTSGYCNCRICVSAPYIFTSFSNMPERIVSAEEFQYHTFLHHSQTQTYIQHEKCCFSTIRFYIILKSVTGLIPSTRVSVPYLFTSFSNNKAKRCRQRMVSVPYVFTSFSNKRRIDNNEENVSVPYVFTSFSNVWE